MLFACHYCLMPCCFDAIIDFSMPPLSIFSCFLIRFAILPLFSAQPMPPAAAPMLPRHFADAIRFVTAFFCCLISVYFSLFSTPATLFITPVSHFSSCRCFSFRHSAIYLRELTFHATPRFSISCLRQRRYYARCCAHAPRENERRQPMLSCCHAITP